MSTAEMDQKFIRRATIVARAAVVAAVIVFLTGILEALLDPKARVYAGVLVGPPAIQLLRRFLNSAVAQPLSLLAMAIIVTMAVRLVASQLRPAWAPKLDKSLARKGLLLARALEVYAWVALVGGFLANSWITVEHAGQGFTRQQVLQTLTFVLGSSITTFFEYLFMAYVVRALVLLSATVSIPQTAEAQGVN